MEHKKQLNIFKIKCYWPKYWHFVLGASSPERQKNDRQTIISFTRNWETWATFNIHWIMCKKKNIYIYLYFNLDQTMSVLNSLQYEQQLLIYNVLIPKNEQFIQKNYIKIGHVCFQSFLSKLLTHKPTLHVSLFVAGLSQFFTFIHRFSFKNQC